MMTSAQQICLMVKIIETPARKCLLVCIDSFSSMGFHLQSLKEAVTKLPVLIQKCLLLSIAIGSGGAELNPSGPGYGPQADSCEQLE